MRVAGVAPVLHTTIAGRLNRPVIELLIQMMVGLMVSGGGGRKGAWVIFHGPPFHQSRISPLLLAPLEHVNSIQQLYKQSRSEAASQNRVDET